MLLRRLIAFSVGFLLLAGFLLQRNVVADISFANPNLIVFEDHFLTTAKTDMSKTTATVDTNSPGYVTISQAGGAVSFSLNPTQREMAVAVKDKLLLFEFTGSKMVQKAGLALPKVKAVSYSSTGNFLGVVADNRIHIYGFTGQRTLVEVFNENVSEADAITGFFNDSFLVLTPQKTVCFGKNSMGWIRYPPGELDGLSKACDISFSLEDSGLAILEGEVVRYYRWNGTEFRPMDAVRVNKACAVFSEAAGVRALGASGSFYYATDKGNLRSFTGLDDAAKGFAIMRSPWGMHDYALLTAQGVEYRGWTASGFRAVPEYSIVGTSSNGLIGAGDGSGSGSGGAGGNDAGKSGDDGAGGNAAGSGEKVYVSKVIPATEPCSEVRLEADQEVPAGASVKYEVSTDGGATFKEVPLDQNVEVNPGKKVVYRIILTAQSSPPKVDRVRLLQIGMKIVPATLIDANGRSRVRLIK